MPWFNVDDGFANSKPVMRISRRYRPLAVGVWTLTGSWSAKELTDGYVPDAVVEEYGGTTRITELLIECELWERAEGGVRFRNWSKWQKTRQQVLDYRAAEAERKRRQRERRSARVNGESLLEEPPEEGCPAGVPSGVPPGRDAESDIPIPKPLPIPTVVTKGGELTRVDATNPDPPRCPLHANDPNPPACGGCADARRLDDERRAAQARQAAARKAARRQAVLDCPVCDDNGWVDTDHGVTRCPQPHSEMPHA